MDRDNENESFDSPNKKVICLLWILHIKKLLTSIIGILSLTTLTAYVSGVQQHVLTDVEDQNILFTKADHLNFRLRFFESAMCNIGSLLFCICLNGSYYSICQLSERCFISNGVYLYITANRQM